MCEVQLLPKPKKQLRLPGTLPVPGGLCVALPEALAGLEAPLKTLWPGLCASGVGQQIRFVYEESLEEECYTLEVAKEGIAIAYHFPAGAFYGLMTLRQIVKGAEDGGLPCVYIEDGPGLKLRGMLMDVSRGKVPSLETLKNLADLLASFKYNHLELYIEGFSFAYPSFPKVWKESSSLSVEELQELDAYCRRRFIELVPHQNSFGHMSRWLAMEEFSHLAEAQEGLKVRGMTFPPTTLNISDSGSLELMKRLIGDLLPAFSSSWFHVGMDEAFEFGKGKNKDLAENGGAVPVLAEYIKGLRNILQESGKTMVMWDDLLVKYPELINHIPKDIQIFDWGYDGEFPVEKRARFLRENGINYCLCPGTSTWSSFTGLTDNMLENIRRAGRAAYDFDAFGIMLTDWGDMNHLQYLPVSYAGIVYNAAFAWNKNGISEEGLADALDLFVYGDHAKIMGRFTLKAGRFYLQEEFRLPCRSLACLPLLYGRVSKETYEEKLKALAEIVTYFSPEEVCQAYLESYRCKKAFDAGKMYSFLEECRQMLCRVQLSCADGGLIVREYANALNILFVLTKIREAIILGNQEDISSRLDNILQEHRFLWLARNKQSGLDGGVQMFERLY